MSVKCRTHYRVVFTGKYKGLTSNDEEIVDIQDKDEVYYLLNVYLDNPDVKIYVCYHDGRQKRVKTKRAWRWTNRNTRKLFRRSSLIEEC